MYRLICILVAVVSLLVPCSALAASYRLADDLALELSLPSERWVVSRQPHESLVEEVAEHMHHDLQAQGREVSQEKVLQAARKRLAANELFIRSTTGAHLEIDISPLRGDEQMPSEKGVWSSARYAGQSMEDEEGVSEASSNVVDFDMPGSALAYRLDVDYVQHKRRMRFVGIIGFEAPYWLYFYGKDPLLDERDATEMEQIIESLSIVR